MKIAGILVRRRIFVSAGLVIVGTGLWLLWSRATQPKISQKPVVQPVSFVRIVGAGEAERDKLLEESAEFLDPAPLFLPTNRNFQQGPLPGRVVKQPGQVFPEFEPKLHFAANTPLPEYGTAGDLVGGNMADMLVRGSDAPYAGFGRFDLARPNLSRRTGFIEVKALQSGVLSISGPLEGLDLPPFDYAPASFVVAISSAGLIGEPVMVTTSGQDEVDAKLRDYLLSGYRIGERLGPGRYVVQIGP